MLDRINPHRLSFMLLAAVVVASGCVQNSSTNFKSDFELDYEDIELNESGQDLYQTSMSQIDNTSSYSIKADNRMAMNLPVISLSVNMSSEGVFETEASDINSSGTISLGIGGNTNSTEFSRRVQTSENGTVITVDENSTEMEKYRMEELGVSLEALKSINVHNVSVLGITNLDGEETILMDLNVNSSELMSNSESIFEVHSPVQESAENGQGMEEIGGFNESKVYLWIEKDSKAPSKFAYFGSANNGALQVRSVTEYSDR